MAIQTLIGGGTFPRPLIAASGSIQFTTSVLVLDASNEAAALVFRAPKTGNIRKIHFRTGTVTTGATVDVRLETVSAVDGFPTGTLFGTTTNVSHVIGDTDDNAWLTTANLTADAAVTRGNVLALVIVNPAVSPGNFQLAQFQDENGFNWPYSPLKAGAGPAWGRSTSSLNLCCAVEYDDGSIGFIDGVWPITALNTATFNSGSDPKELGLYFQVPWPCAVDGVWLWTLVQTTSGAFDLILYDSDGTTVLGTISQEPVQQGNNTWGHLLLPFPSVISLAKATNYRLVVKPTSSTNVTLQDCAVNAAALMDGIAGGQTWHYTQKSAAGSWSQTTTKRPFMGLRIAGFDDGVGVVLLFAASGFMLLGVQ